MQPKVRLGAGVSLAAVSTIILWAEPANAQQAQTQQPTAQGTGPATTPAPDQATQSAARNEANPGDVIVVTAQKREQLLTNVSLSVAAVSGDKLAATQTNNIEQLQKLVPSVSFGNDFNFAKLFIRGIGLSSSLPGVDPSVALHVDGAVVSLAQAQLGSLFDLQRVEVLRGPQGTLYGRNATGGAVNLITAKPTAKLNGYARLTVGNYDNVIAEAAVGGPIAPGVRARVAVQRVKRGGYGKNELTGHDIDNADQWSARAHLELLPTDKLDVLLTGEIHTEDDRSLAIKFRDVSFPGVLTDANPANDSLSALGQRDGASFARKVRDLNTNFDPINDRKQWALTGTTTYNLTDQLNLKSITSYRKFRAIFFHDFDMSSYAGYPLAQTTAFRTSANHWQPVWQHQFTEEFQFNFDTEKLHGIAAAFFLDEHIRVENHIGYDVLTNTDPFRVQFDGKLDIKTWAAFANATYDLFDRLSLKAGARYSWEHRHVTNNSGIGTAATGFRLDPLQWDVGKTWKNFSPTLGFEYRPFDHILFYGNWAKGYKSGTAEIGSRRSASALTPFVDPEKVEAFEVGMKGTFDTLQLNLAAFHHKLKNGQFQRTFPIPVPPFFASQLENAAESKANGVELESRWRPISGLTIDAAVAYLDSKFTKFLSRDPLDPRLFGPGGTSLPLEDLSGNRTRNSPKWSVNFNPTYRLRLANSHSVTFAANVAYKSKQYHTEFNDDRLAQGAYTLIDANVLYAWPGERYTVNLWAKNLTNKLVWAGSYAVATSRTIGGTLMPPRTYGVTVGFNLK